MTATTPTSQQQHQHQDELQPLHNELSKTVADPLEVGSDGTADSSTTASLTSSSFKSVSTRSSMRSNSDASTLSNNSNNNDININTPQPRKSVRFSQVSIREYGITLGDHPGTGVGPPLTIEWNHHTELTVQVDDYEQGLDQMSRRKGPELRMPQSVRQEMLKDQHTKQEMQQAQREANRVRSNRNLSVALEDVEHFEVAWQSAVRKFKRWKRRGATKEPAEVWMQQQQQLTSARRSSAVVPKAPSSTTRIQKEVTRRPTL